jgi:uncharacterized protein YjbI with pentapeptide repeats
MALRDPKDVLHKGTRLDELLDAHARWLRNEPGGLRADFSDGKLFNIQLRGHALSCADFSRCDLHRSDLTRCDLSSCELSEADLRECVARKVKLANAVAQRVQLHRADFSFCEGARVSLAGSNQVGTVWRGSRLDEADFSSAKIFRGDFRNCALALANFSEAEIVETQFAGGRLPGAKCEQAKFLNCDFRACELTGIQIRQARFDDSWLGLTRIGACELSRAFGLETMRHFGPTWIDAETLAQHAKFLPPEFLYGAGVRVSSAKGKPEPLARDGQEICVILHANRDADFAARLRLDLMANGIRCWFLPEEISWSGIELERAPYDQIIVVCSRNALESRPLVAEMKAALDREESEQRECVLPVRVDDYLYEEWQHAQKDALLRKHVGDFRNWRDSDLYRSALDHLLDALHDPTR